MEFGKLNNFLQKHFDNMSENSDKLFIVNADKDKIWDLYLNGFDEKYNQVYRERREHDCVACKQFIRKFGKVVSIKDNQLHTIWDVEIESEEYAPVFKALSDYIKSEAVVSVFMIDEKFTNNSSLENHRVVGTPFNFEQLEDGATKKWEHFALDIPKRFVYSGHDTVGSVLSNLNAVRSVFKRSLDELTQDSVETVLELIMSNTLYKGAEWKSQLQEFLKHKKAYSELSKDEQELYAWEQSIKVGGVIGKIRNHSIGTLLIDLSGRVKEDGEVVEPIDLDLAVRKYEKVVAPENYKRPNAIYTKKMLEDAQKTVERLGYMDSLARRHAKLDDITVNNILFVNKDSAKKLGRMNVFDEMKEEVAINPKKFSKIEEIGVNDFINNVLPTAKEVEVLLEGRHKSNMVSLIAPENKDAKSMLKWDNNFSWAYDGNIADSSMKERVKSAGGSVTGDLRFSIQWNEEGQDNTDLDAHCQEPRGGSHIYYSSKRSVRTEGTLDVDIQSPGRNIAVENITWATRDKMIDGTYKLYVNDYSGRGARGGFRAEVEFDGNVYSFNCPPFTNRTRDIQVAEITLKNGVFTINEKLESNMSSIDVWGLKTNQFVPVSTLMYSPNYWNSQEGIGHKHLFFMLKDCKNDSMANGFFNEFLDNELNDHRKVFEALGSKMRVEDSDEQLSGVGFSTTKRNEIVVKIKGHTERIMRVKF